MLGRNRQIIKVMLWVCALVTVFTFCWPTDALAAFTGLTGSGKTIFAGLRSIIYPASAIGVICVCIGGIFGNINWKWLTALFVGLVVITLCGTFIEAFTGRNENGLDAESALNGN